MTWPTPPQDLENIYFIKKETSRLVKEYQEKKSQLIPKVATPQQILHSHRTNLLEAMVTLRRHIENNEGGEIKSLSQKIEGIRRSSIILNHNTNILFRRIS